MSDTLRTAPVSAEAESTVVTWIVDLLEEPEAGAQDNFLDLGGHSMLALQLNERVKERFGAELDIQVLFESSIGEAVAELLSRTG
ncbi:phosphopantetheine-binding protein [Streptomyces sp. NPDC051162]|uniref:phosphopantetheine-binding protein n=1 Tax=unclassified Streptomyces TaxID=2593676 RepID=UPI00342CF43A